MAEWSLLTSHARLLLAIDREPGLRQREMAARLGLTERGVAIILRDLRAAGYVREHREGRRVKFRVVPDKPVRGALAAAPTVGQLLQLFAAARGATSETRLPEAQGFRSYYMRLRVAEASQAEALALALAQQGAVLLEREAGIVALLWPAAEADEPEEWEERTFAEAIFFLRAWSAGHPERDVTVLDERPVDVPEEAHRRAS